MLLRNKDGKVYGPVGGQIVQIPLPFHGKAKKIIRPEGSNSISLTYVLTTRGELYRYLATGSCFVRILPMHKDRMINVWDITFVFGPQLSNSVMIILDNSGIVYHIRGRHLTSGLNDSEIDEGINCNCTPWEGIPLIDNFFPNVHVASTSFLTRDAEILVLKRSPINDGDLLDCVFCSEDYYIAKNPDVPIEVIGFLTGSSMSFNNSCLCSSCVVEKKSYNYSVTFVKLYQAAGYYIMDENLHLVKLFHGRKDELSVNFERRFKALNRKDIIDRVISCYGGLYFRFDNELVTLQASKVISEDIALWNRHPHMLKDIEEVSQYMSPGWYR